MSTDPSSQIVISDPTTSVVVSVNDPTVAAAAIHSSNSTDTSGAEALVGHHHLQQEQQQHDVSANVQEDITITDPDHQNHGIHVVYNQYTTTAGTGIEAMTTSEVVVNNEMPTIHTPDPTMMHNSGNTVNNMEGVSFNTMGATDQQVQHTGVELTKREEDSDQQYGTPQQMQVQMHHQQQQHHQVSMVQEQNTNNNPAPTSNIQVQDVASPTTTTTQVVGTPGQVQVQTQQMTPGSIIGGGLSVQIPNATVSTTAQILSDNFRRRTRRSEGSPRIRKAAMLMIENPSLDRYSALVSSGYTKEEASSKKRLNNVSQRKRRLAQYLSDSAANGGGNNGVCNSKGGTNITNNGTAQSDPSMMMGGMQGVQMNVHHHMNHDSMPQSVVTGNNTVPPMPPLSMGAGQSSSYQQTAAIPTTTPMQRDILISIVRDDERKGFVLLNKMSSAQDNGQLHYYHGEITLWDMLKRAPKDTGIFQIDTDGYDFPVLVVRRMKPTNNSNTATTSTTENGVDNTEQHHQQQQSSMDTEEYDDTFEFEFRKKEMQEFTVFKLMETFGFENTFSVQLKMTKQPHLEDKKNISLDD